MDRRTLLAGLALGALPMLAKAGPLPQSSPVFPLSRANGGNGLAPFQLPNWRKAMAGVLTQTSNATVCVVGDSTTMGENTAGVFSPKNVTYWLAQKLQAANPLLITNQNAVAGNPGKAGFTRMTVDPRFAVAGTVAQGPQGFGGPLIQMAAGSTITYTPGVAFDTAVIQIYNGTVSIQVTGGTAVNTTATNPNLALGTATTATASASNTITLSASATAYVVSIQCYNSTQKSLNLMNVGYYGGLATAICGTGTGGFTPVACISQLAPALTILNVGINDWNVPTATATFISTLQPFIAAGQVSGDVILAIGIPNNTNTATQAAYLAAMQNLAQTLNIPFVDFQSRWVSYAASNTLGLFSDLLHPSSTYGMPDIAQAYADVLLAA